MDFDESDESIAEEVELDAELSKLLIDKLRISIYNCLQVQKRASSERERGSFGLLEAMEATISKNLEAGEEMLLFPATSTQAERLVSWMGFLFIERRLSFHESACPCSFSSRTTSSSNPLMEQLYL